MPIDDGLVVSDRIVAIELVDCPSDPPVTSVPLPSDPPSDSPVRQAMQATLAHTGADPPPMVMRG